MFRCVVVALWLALPALAAGSAWKPVQGDGFTISFPGDAKRSEQLEPTDVGDVRMVNYELASEDGSSYLLLSVSDIDPALMKLVTPKETLDHARDGAVRQEQGEVKSQRAVALVARVGGKKKVYSGLEFEAALPAGVTVLARVYLVENRLYQLMAQFDRGQDRRDDFKKFVASFRLERSSPKVRSSEAFGKGLLESSDGGALSFEPER